MSQRDKLIDSLRKEIATNVKQLAGLIDMEQHDDDNPGRPCPMCICRVVATTLLQLGLRPMEGLRVGHLMEDTMRIATGEFPPYRDPTYAEFAELRTTMAIEDMKDVILVGAREAGADLNRLNADDVAHIDRMRYSAASMLLHGLVKTSEEVTNFVMPNFINLEAATKAAKDLDNRRN